MLETHPFNPVLDKEFILENYDTTEYLLEVWGDFLALMPEEIEELKQAQAAGDKDRLVKKIHASSSAIGFTGGIALCDRMKDFEYKGIKRKSWGVCEKGVTLDQAEYSRCTY